MQNSRQSFMEGGHLRGKCFCKQYQLFILSPLVQEETQQEHKNKDLLKNERSGREGKGERGKPSDYSDNLTIKKSEY